MTELHQYFTQINEALNNQDGDRLADLLSLSELITMTLNNHPNNPMVKQLGRLQEKKYVDKTALIKRLDQHVRKVGDLDSMVENKVNVRSLSDVQNQAYVETVTLHLYASSAIIDNRYADAFKYISESITSFLKGFEVWSASLMWKMCWNMRIMAKLANINTGATSDGKKIDYYEEASRTLSRCFQNASADRSTSLEQSKKKAVMGISNHLFHIYFKINNLKLCKNLIKAIESPGFPALDSYPLSQLITYRFFVGRLAAFDGNFKKAQEDLQFAFNKCPSNVAKNKRLILLYLIPMQLAQRRFPKKQLLLQYNLPQFIGIVEGMKTGDMKQFNQCLTTHQNYFISKGIYLILEKLKNIVYRNLFKKIYLIQNQSKIPIQNFVTALKWADNDTVDVDEAECIISNLIYNGFIKGYISHKVALVLSPNNPFPNNY
eukprot:gene15599-18533_t